MRLQDVQLVTGSLEQCRLFYSELLGLQVMEVSAGNICFRVGSGLLHFREVEQSHPLYHMAFSIPNNMLEAALEWLDRRTVILPYSPESVLADFTGWNAKAFYFRDAGGNILECITHFDEHSYREGPFSGDCFSSIMEIGLPVEDVTVACADFNERYGLPYFTKGPRLKDFSVMGDEEGMLIVIKQGRGWLPTQEPAEPFPVTLLVDHHGKNSRLEFG